MDKHSAAAFRANLLQNPSQNALNSLPDVVTMVTETGPMSIIPPAPPMPKVPFGHGSARLSALIAKNAGGSGDVAVAKKTVENALFDLDINVSDSEDEFDFNMN